MALTTGFSPIASTPPLLPQTDNFWKAAPNKDSKKDLLEWKPGPEVPHLSTRAKEISSKKEALEAQSTNPTPKYIRFALAISLSLAIPLLYSFTLLLKISQHPEPLDLDIV